MGWSWHKQTRSSMMERRHRQLLSGLPPANNFSIQPHDLVKRRPWPAIHVHGTNAGPVTKSWLPTGTRCGGPHGPPQLRHVSTGPPETHALRPHGHRFLSNPDDILETPLGMLEASHWRCLLEECSNAKKQPESEPSDDARLKLQLGLVSLATSAPCSGLSVSYSVLMRDNNTSASLGWRWTVFRQVSIRWECAVPDPFDSRRKRMEFTSVVHCGGKWYAITLQGAVVVMEMFGRRLRITAVGSTRAVPSWRSRVFKEYLVEMKGEILMVYLIHQESVEVVDNVEVFRLDLDKLHWIKVERLRGKTMFLKESGCVWVESAEFGCRDDCVFFTQGKESLWRVYDMKKCLISPVL